MPARTAIIALPLPRVVVGTPRRCREPERVAVHDLVNLEVTSVTAEEAPVAVRLEASGLQAKTRGNAWRAFGGAFWRPLDYGMQVEGILPRQAGPALLDRVLAKAGFPGDGGDGSQAQDLADWETILGGVNKRRGLRDARQADFSDVRDDGRAAQAALAEAISANLLLVDGRVHHRSPEPRYSVDWSDGDGMVTARTSYWPAGAVAVPPMAADEFPVDRGADAMAFCKAMVAEAVKPGGEASAGYGSVFRIVDVEAFHAAAARPSLALAAPGLLSRAVEEARILAGHLDDASLAGFMALRAGVRDGFPDDASAGEAFETLRAMLPRYAEAVPNDTGWWRDKAEAAREAGWEALMRWDVSERARHGLADEDDLALESLGPTP